LAEKRLNRFLKKTSKAFAKRAKKVHDRFGKKKQLKVVAVENVEKQLLLTGSNG
jgi:hypothetical protein